MKLWAAAVALTAFIVGPAPRANGDMPPVPPAEVAPVPAPGPTIDAPPLGAMVCEKQGAGPRCLISKASIDRINAVLDMAGQTVEAMGAENEQLRHELAKLREIKGCAKVVPEAPRLPPGPRTRS